MSPKRSAAYLSAVLDFAEHFTGECEAQLAAREVAAELRRPAVSPGIASVLTLLAKLAGAKNAVEVGTGTGVSALAVLAGMGEDGMLTSIDPDTELQLATKELFREQGVPARKVRLIAGQPLDVLPKLTDAGYDIFFVNGDPVEYPEYVAQAGRLLRPGGVFVLNNVFWNGQVAAEIVESDEALSIRDALLAAAADEEVVTAVLPLGDGILVGVLPS